MKPVRRFFCGMAGCALLCLAAWPAVAQQHRRPWLGSFAEQFALQVRESTDSPERPSGRRAERRAEQQEADADTRDKERDRLSSEDRRQLRRDVRDAGRDIYSDRMRPDRRNFRGR